MPKLDLYHGVTVKLLDIGPRTVSLPSSSIIGLVDVYAPGTGLVQPNKPVKITNLKEGAQAFGVNSPIYQQLKTIYAKTSAVVAAIGVEKNADANAQTSAIIGGVTGTGVRTGLQALLDAKSEIALHPRLIVAPGHSSKQAVAAAMDSLAGKLRAIAIIDGPNTTDDAAIAYAQNFGSKRLYMVDAGGIKVWDSVLNGPVVLPASAAVAGMFAARDAEVGFWASPSNSEFAEVLGTGRPVEYLYGDPTCRANLLNQQFITTIIREGGFRLWGNRTLSSDPKWSFVTRVRTTDMVMDAILAGHQWAVDRGLTKTFVKDVTEGINAFMRDLRNAGALINFEVFPDPLLNTASQLEEGKAYWNIRFTDVPPAENPIFQIEVTNQWITEILGQ
ncbi:phage tail sheath subtilisin-like domain-containing protein [Chitinimonas sp. PSY-7]|uniref:phage tail sheath subtilisin-like domain-containing protein n=1 Tax=Chitinimonas sp. PSY-7 TaxID=3459088 RepID=UPI00403FF714